MIEAGERVVTIARSADGDLQAERSLAGSREEPDESEYELTCIGGFGEKLFAGTNGAGLLALEGSEFEEVNRGTRPFFVQAITSDTSGNTWVGGRGGGAGVGLYQISEAGKPKQYGIATGDVLALAPDGNGGVWAGTNRNGLFHFRGPTNYVHYTFENTSGGLRSNTVHTIFIDLDGVVWVGTNRGISRFDPASPYHQILSDNVNGNFVRVLHTARNGDLWAGTNRGLFRRSGDEWEAVGDLRELPIYALGEDLEGAILAGTPVGLLDSTGETLLDGDIRGIGTIGGRIFAATFGSGLFLIEGEEPVLRYGHSSITTLTNNGDRILFGTAADGVFSFDGNQANNIVGQDVLGQGAVWTITVSDEGALLIGGEHGLFRIHEDANEQIIAGHDVRSVVARGSDIWAATSDLGIIHIRTDPIFGRVETVIGTEHGLPSEKLFALSSDNGTFVIGTNRGVATYIPGSAPPRLLPVRIASRRLHDPSEMISTIDLEFPQDSLLIEVAGQSSRTFPEEFKYAFRLTNAAGDIIHERISADSQFAPQSLRPGEYLIEAWVFDRDLLRSEPLSFRFSIARAPFPWTATALGVLLAVAIVALVWAMIERRRIVIRNRELAAARFDLANEAERERSRIARDLHDQTLADLRNLLMKTDRTTVPELGLRQEIESISTEVRRICEDLSPSLLENIGLVAALEFLLSHTTEKYRFDSAKADDDRINFPFNVQVQIYRIAQEVLTNINRHSNPTTVEMNLSTPAPGRINIEIRDDGDPFSPSPTAAQKGRGISGIRTRASMIDAVVGWRPRQSGGTVFTLRIGNTES
jgi:signal transduction histidine kinase